VGAFGHFGNIQGLFMTPVIFLVKMTVSVANSKSMAAVKAAPSGLASIKSLSKEIEAMANFDVKILNSKFDEMLLAFNPEARRLDVTSSNGHLLRLTKSERGFSLSQILAQALQNNDKQMLEAALCVSSTQHTEVLNTSLLRLPQASIVPLLEALTTRIAQNPKRTAPLLPWIRALLTCHASYLSTIPSASKLLAPLQQAAEERVSALPSLLRLHGRLELLMSQVQLRKMRELEMATSGHTMNEQPLALYDESEDEQNAEEDQFDMDEVDNDDDDDGLGCSDKEEDDNDVFDEDDSEDDEDVDFEEE